MKKLILFLAFLVSFVSLAIAKDTEVVRISYDGSDNPEYIGTAPQNASTAAATWKIMKITYSGANPVTVEWADGNDKADNIWDNRASLSYR